MPDRGHPLPPRQAASRYHLPAASPRFPSASRMTAAKHVLDVAARLQVDEDLRRPHQVVRTVAVEQDHCWVCLHSCRHRLEVLAGLLVVSPLTASRGVGVLRRGRLVRLIFLARLDSSTWMTGGPSPAASLGIVIIGITAVGALKGEVVGAVAQPALSTSTSSSSTTVLGRLCLVGILGRLPTTASTAANLPALSRSTTLLHWGGIVHLRQELHGPLSLLHRLVPENERCQGVLV
ncbi:unnamed protein product [Closterium sp. NIES-53]